MLLGEGTSGGSRARVCDAARRGRPGHDPVPRIGVDWPRLADQKTLHLQPVPHAASRPQINRSSLYKPRYQADEAVPTLSPGPTLYA